MTRWLALLLAPAVVAGIPSNFEPFDGGFLARTARGAYRIQPSGSLRFARDAEMRFTGANPAARAEPFGLLPGKTNYLRGADPSQWRTGVPQYAGVRYANVYPGVDLIYHADSGLEYDLRIAPRASPRKIAMEFTGAESVSLDRDGALIVRAGGGELRFARPRITQEGREVRGGYRLLGARRVAFSIGPYDHNRPLLIDPVIGAFGTFGALFVTVRGLATDANGNVYIAGDANASFPIVNALQPGLGTGNCAAYANDVSPCQDVFVAKLDPTATTILYSTYLGDNGADWFGGLAVDAQGNAYVSASSYAPGFYSAQPSGTGHGFVRKLSPDGSALLYDVSLAAATQAASIAVDATENAYIAGTSYSSSFPAVHAIQSQTLLAPMFASKDGGATWTPVKIPATQVSMLAIPPGQSSTIYAATPSGLLKSNDAGNTWASLISNATTLVVVDPKAPSTLYAAYTIAGTEPQYVLARSTDAGTTWTAFTNIPTGPIFSTSPAVAALAVDPENSSNLWIAAGGLPAMVDKSTDGGASWQIVYGVPPVPPPFPFSPSGILIDPTNSAHVYTCCANRPGGGVFFTQDGGVTWTEGSAGPQAGSGGIHAPVLDPSNPFTLYATWYYGLDQSTDGGQSWTGVNTPSIPQNVNNVLIDPSGVIYVISDAGYFLRSPDKGVTWVETQGPWALNSVLLAIDPLNPNTVYVGSPQTSIQDAFAMKLDATGNTVWATLLGGSGADSGQSIAVDAQGNAYLAGITTSTDFPLANPVQARLGNGIGNRADAFVAEISSSGSTLVYSTYLGGRADESGVSLAVDASGEAFVAGITQSTDFPQVNPLSVAPALLYETGFAAKFAPGGKSLVFSTYFPSLPNAVAFDSTGAPWLAGAGALTLPLVQPVQAAAGGGFVSRLTPSGSAFPFSTYLCEMPRGVAPVAGGSVWVAGTACSGDFPSIGAASQNPGVFVARIDSAPPATQPGVPRIDAVYDGASFEWGNAVAPGEVVTLIGAELASATQSAASAPLPASLSDVSVTIGGIAAPLYYVSPTQINFQAPLGLTLGAADLAVTRGATVTHRAVNAVAARPGIFFVNGVPAVTHASDFSLVTAANPAHPGEYLAVFCSGLGATTPAVAAGQVSPLALLQAQAFGVVGGREINVQYAGLAPGSIGLYQVNFQLPSDTSSGLTDLYLSAYGSTNDVPLYVQ